MKNKDIQDIFSEANEDTASVQAYAHSMIANLGIKFFISPPSEVYASMPVDERTIQPFQALSGGASLALAESMAGHGSLALCQEKEFPCGIQVSANHIAMAKRGETVFAHATLVHKGRSSHVWNVDIVNAHKKLISSVRVVNQIIVRT